MIALGLNITVTVVLVLAIAIASLDAGRWSATKTVLLGAGLFFPSWVLVLAVGWVASYPFYGHQAEIWDAVAYFVVLACQLVMVVALYPLFAWLYRKLGGQLESET